MFDDCLLRDVEVGDIDQLNETFYLLIRFLLYRFLEALQICVHEPHIF